MKRFGFNLFAAVLAGSLSAFNASAATNAPPDFKEVYELLRAHLAGTNEKELNRAAVEGLVSQLAPRVSIGTTSVKSNSNEKLITKSSLFDGPIGCIRIARVGEGLAKSVQKAHHELNTTNKLKGLVFDLRFANGEDYGSAAEVADLFCANERPLMNWGNGMVRSKPKSDALKLPVAVLVNRQTSGAAEALAATLRELGVGLIIGTNTAGQAAIMEEFPLKNGEQLRIATATIKLGNGTLLPMRGVKPDIELAVNAAEEKIYLSDPFAELTQTGEFAASSLSTTNSSGTNRFRRRLSEAELVRQRREGVSLDDLPEKDTEREKPEVRDPALARALDVLKGLAVVRQFRAN